MSGYGSLSAHTAKESTFYSSIKKSIEEETATFCATPTEQASYFSTSSSSGTAQKNHRKLLTAEFEIEEDESLSLKAFLDSARYVAAIVYAFICGYLFRYLNKCFNFSKHLSLFSAYRWHITLQVFRV
ncbi:hypothetical protein D1627_15140 [Pontibacter oryzae]|uniref:Uncharacterized protein n=1 Tax=Pontibacter oryzae TaxID=2304593 RepID=A0A399RT46_9BACT|nr:hypothetical protein D1627_15140 [Pontibacter oryzae]